MAKRNPKVTQRNKKINEMTAQLDRNLTYVLTKTGLTSLQSINGKFGGKHAEFIDIENEVIRTPEEFVSLYFQGFLDKLETLGMFAESGNTYYDLFKMIKDDIEVREWVILFLKRTYLRNFEALSKVRPKPTESVFWIGQENASYGLVITPRFANGQWENDRSEIRHFRKKYWTIGHILSTGFVIPHNEKTIRFQTFDEYLTFFENVLVRNSGSKHELEIAKRYCKYVLESPEPESIPLLIPELRYNGIDKKHKYRLDFTIINYVNMSKVGFELSPWSTHGKLTKVKDKTQKDINDEARANFENEMKKHKSYFRKFGITVLIYTDNDLKNYDKIFDEMILYLNPQSSTTQLEFQSIEDFLSFDD